jgi:hypothetical protein
MGQRHPGLDSKPKCYSKAGGRRDPPGTLASAIVRASASEHSDTQRLIPRLDTNGAEVYGTVDELLRPRVKGETAKRQMDSVL